MYEKASKYHPDKVADRIAGAIVDLAYKQNPNALINVEVLFIMGKNGLIAIRSSEDIEDKYIKVIIKTTCPKTNFDIVKSKIDFKEKNRFNTSQTFVGYPKSNEEKKVLQRQNLLVDKTAYKVFYSESDGKEYRSISASKFGATNRKLGSDLGRANTGAGLHGKDLTNADLSLSVLAYITAQKEHSEIHCFCVKNGEQVVLSGLGFIQSMCYEKAIGIVRDYIYNLGGFEKFAEFGLIR